MRQTPGLLLVLAYLAFISLGLPDGLLGVAWPSMSSTFGLPLSAMGLLLVAASVGFLASSLNSGRILARFGVGKLLFVSSLLGVLGLVGLALAPTWPLLLLASLLLGAGGGAIDAGLNTYAAHHFSERHMNWLHASFGFGTMLGPLIMVTALTNGPGWRWGYATVAVLLLGMTVCFWFTRRRWEQGNAVPGTSEDADTPATPLRLGALLRQPLVWLSIALFFFQTGVEVSTGQWAYTLLTEGRNVDSTTAGIWVSIYWGMFTLGRLVIGVLVNHIAARTILRVSMGVLLVGALLLWLTPTPQLSFVGLALMGFALAPVFPLLMAQTPARLGSAAALHVIGFQVAAASVAAALVPATAGALAGLFGVEALGPFLLLVALLLWLSYELALLLQHNRARATCQAPSDISH